MTIFIKSDSSIVYSYDDKGERILKKTTSVNEYYLRDHTGRELAIYDLTANWIKMANIFGNGLIGRVDVNYTKKSGFYYDENGTKTYYSYYERSDNRNYYLKDHLGSNWLTINSLGVITNAQDYYAYGEVLRSYNNSSPNEKYKFTGKERDTETDLDYFGARYYDSELGRWTSVDPLAEKYPNWSPYNYCLNNPLAIIDPNGMDTLNITVNKNRDVPGTAELIVNGESVELQGGNEVLGRGSKNKKNPQRDPLKFGGDTPTGEVIVDGVVDLDPNSKYVDESGTAVDQTFSTNPPKDIKAYGRYFISLKPVAGQFLESSKTRSGIGGHGGGTKLGNRAIVSKQNLVATMGCLRFTNQTDAQLYNQGKDALNNKREFRWIIKEK